MSKLRARTAALLRSEALVEELLQALEAVTKKYVSLVDSGDCGFWDPETESEVMAARAIIAKVQGETQCSTKVWTDKATGCQERECWCHADKQPIGFFCSQCGCLYQEAK